MVSKDTHHNMSPHPFNTSPPTLMSRYGEESQSIKWTGWQYYCGQCKGSAWWRGDHTRQHHKGNYERAKRWFKVSKSNGIFKATDIITRWITYPITSIGVRTQLQEVYQMWEKQTKRTIPTTTTKELPTINLHGLHTSKMQVHLLHDLSDLSRRELHIAKLQ